MKTRRWFQIHWLTAVVLIAAAGLLVWANFHPFLEYYPYINKCHSYGWPVVMMIEPEALFPEHRMPLQPLRLGSNVLMGVCILAALHAIFEGGRVSNSDTPRAWFQFRLSTMLVSLLMTVALITLQFNVMHKTLDDLAESEFPTQIDYRGFPCAWWTRRVRSVRLMGKMVQTPNGRSGRWLLDGEVAEAYVDSRALVNDVVLSLAVLALSVRLVMWYNRRI